MRKAFLAGLAFLASVLMLFNASGIVHATVLVDSGRETEETEADEIWAAESLSNQIENLKNFDLHTIPEEKIVELHREYDRLSMAAKTHVADIDYLIELEEKLKISYIPENSETQESRIGTKYIVPITASRPQVSLVVRYMTDKDGDGNPDAPGISLVSPSGKTYPIQEEMKSLETSDLSLSIVSDDKFTQLNFVEAEEGNWLAVTDTTSHFTILDYAGKIDYPSFSGETDRSEVPTEKPTESSTEEPKKESGSVAWTIIKLVLVLLAIVGILIGSRILIRKIREKKSGIKKNDDEFDNDEDDTVVSTKEADEEEELRRVREFLANKTRNENAVKDDSPKDQKQDKKQEAPEHQEKDEDKGPGYEEFVDYPSGIVGKENGEEKKDEDSGFGSRF